MGSLDYRTTGGGAGSDTTAIHDNVAGEIAAITEKATPAGADMLIIEDSDAANVKKRVPVSAVGGYVNPYFGAMSAPTIGGAGWVDMNTYNDAPDANIVALPGAGLRLTTDGNWAKFDYTDDAAQSVGAALPMAAGDFIRAFEVDVARTDRATDTTASMLSVGVTFAEEQNVSSSNTWPNVANGAMIFYNADNEATSWWFDTTVAKATGYSTGHSSGGTGLASMGAGSIWVVIQRSGLGVNVWVSNAVRKPIMMDPTSAPYTVAATAGLLVVCAYVANAGAAGEVMFREAVLDSIPWGG